MTTFAMFTDAGNNAVASLVTDAKRFGMDWPQVNFALQILARKPEFAEATDTAVREAVFCALFEVDEIVEVVGNRIPSSHSHALKPRFIKENNL
jgi:hypothetical protein